MNEIERKSDILKRSEIFLGLPDDVLNKLVTQVSCNSRYYGASEVIISIEDISKDLFIVEDGKVDLVLVKYLPETKSEIKVVLDTVCQGGTFGWSTLTGTYSYGLFAICTEPVKVLAINGNELLNFLDKEKATGYEIMKALSRIVVLRLRDSNRALFKVIASKSDKD